MIDLTGMAIALGQALGFPSSSAGYTGGLILSSAVLITVVLAMSSLGGRNRNGEAALIATAAVVIVTTGMLFVIGWMPFVFLILAVIFIGVMVAMRIKEGLAT